MCINAETLARAIGIDWHLAQVGACSWSDVLTAFYSMRQLVIQERPENKALDETRILIDILNQHVQDSYKRRAA